MEETRSDVRNSRKPCLARQRVLSPFQLRLLFRRIEIHEKNSIRVSVTTFRRCFRRVLDMFDPNLDFNLDEFGAHSGGSKMTWEDVREAIDGQNVPAVPLSIPQIVFLAMEDPSTSHLAMAWYSLNNLAIVVNISIMILQSLPGYSPGTQSLFTFALSWCIRLFTVDYCAKAFCVMWCPIALFDEVWMLDNALPCGEKEYLISRSLHTTKGQRLWYWATCGRNIVDFCSILPNLLSFVIVGMHLPLTSLRMVRFLGALRILRAFKAVGKWVTTLQTLGEAFFSSMGAVFVLVLYMGVFSLVAGAVLYEQEHRFKDAKDFVNVPTSMGVVVEDFVGKSLSAASSLMGKVVLACVGMFKGIIILLPIDKLKKATKSSADHFERMSALKEQVERETMLRSLPKGISWASDFACPTARFEVLDDTDVNDANASVGTAHVPIFEARPVEAALLVPLHGGTANRLFGAPPELKVLVRWTPAPDEDEPSSEVPTRRQKKRMPKGDLSLRVLEGSNFGGSETMRWQVRMFVPEKLYGVRSNSYFGTPWSSSGSPSPAWGDGDDAEGLFDVAWEDEEEEEPEETTAEAFRRKVLEALDAGPGDHCQFERRTMELLQQQSKRIQDLERHLTEASESTSMLAAEKALELPEQIEVPKKVVTPRRGCMPFRRAH